MALDGVPAKIIAMIKANYRSATARVLVRNNLSQPFGIRSGVRQGCILSPILFNYAIGWIFGRALRESDCVEFAPGHRLTDLDYTYDIALLASSFGDLQSMVSQINEEEKEKMEKCIKKAWMNVTLWKHRYEQSCKKYAVLEEQFNQSERMEKAALVIRLNRVDEELRRLKMERVSNTAAVNPTSGDSTDLTYLRTELKRLEREALEAEASERVKLLGQEISLRDLEISSYKDKLAQLQCNFARQDQMLSARLEELESYKSRELELRRSFAQQIQSLEMSLSGAHHAFAVREKQLLQQLHSAKM
ncbi:hypothetical protein SprV_0401433400 [Sparganum proliferum]